MRVHTVILIVSGVVESVIPFANEEDADAEYKRLQQEHGSSDKYEVLQYENALNTRQDAMSLRYGYLGVTEEDVNSICRRLKASEDEKRKLLERREELSERVADSIMETEFEEACDDIAWDILKEV